MKAVVCLCTLLVIAIARPEDKYTSKYDNLDVQEIIGNIRLLYPYINCALDQGRCTPQAKEFRSHIKDALETHCARCTQKQQENTHIVIRHLINHEPDYWRQLCDKYDPDGKYAAKYEEELKTTARTN